MEDHLEKIRREHPDLNPTETYALLSEAVMPDVAEWEIEYDDFVNALTQYEERLQSQIQAVRENAIPQSAWELLKPYGREWLKKLEDDQRDMDLFFDEIKDMAKGFPNEARIKEFVAGKIQNEYPQFNMEYLEHQKWLEINAERLARQEERQFPDEPEQTRGQDGLSR